MKSLSFATTLFSRLLAVCGVAGLVMAAAVPAAQAGVVSFSPTTRNVSGNMPFTQSVTFTVTSPDDFSGTASIGFNVVPVTGTPAEAASYVSVSAARPFSGPEDSVQVTVTFTMPVINVAPGTVLNYAYSIYTTGWGPSFVDGFGSLNARVTVPPPSATGTPAVTISTPQDQATFSYTANQLPATIPLSFQAVTADSLSISAIEATLNGAAVVLTTTGIGTSSATGTANLIIAQPGTYTVLARATNTNGDGSATSRFTVSVSGPPPTVTINYPAANSSYTYVAGGTQVHVPVSVTATTPEGTSTTIQAWNATLTQPSGAVVNLGSPSLETGGLGTTSITGSVPLDLTAGGNYTLTVTANNQYLSASASTSFTISVVYPPTITTQPANLTLAPGASATFTVVATGSPTLTYQWSKGTTAIPGATAASLTLSNITAADAGSYSVVVSNAYGYTTSTAATLTLLTPPVITTPPASVSAAVGTSASFSVVATGSTPLSYQWMMNGTNITGATSDTYTIASVVTGSAGNYSVKVSNGAGSVTSSAATLTVLVPPTVVVAPAALTVNPGQNATFTATVTSALPVTYQWQKNGGAIAGATSASLTLSAVTAADAATYRVLATNAGGTATSNNATLTVRTPPTITTQPASATVSAGQSVTFSVVATGTPTLTYQWRKDGVNIANATSASLTLTNVATASQGAYSVVVSNLAGSVTSNNATLTVLSGLTVTINQPVNGAVITRVAGSPATSVPFNFVASAPGGKVSALSAKLNGSSVSVTKSGLNTATATGTGTLSVRAAGSYTFAATATSAAGETKTTSVTFTVRETEPEPQPCTTVLHWLPPISLEKVQKGGSVVAIKFHLHQCCKDSDCRKDRDDDHGDDDCDDDHRSGSSDKGNASSNSNKNSNRSHDCDDEDRDDDDNHDGWKDNGNGHCPLIKDTSVIITVYEVGKPSTTIHYTYSANGNPNQSTYSIAGDKLYHANFTTAKGTHRYRVEVDHFVNGSVESLDSIEFTTK